MPSLPRFSPSRVGTALDFRTRGLRRRARLAVDLAAAPLRHADVALFHEFSPPPGGGGNQFLRALSGELERRGLRLESNRLSRSTPACLYNSFNFDFARLRAFAREDCRMVHRVDGPIGVYRGRDDGTDRRIWELNDELANATVFQSRYSREAHRELGLEFRDPVVIPNAVDPAIFHRAERQPPAARLRVVAASWSTNPRKGFDVLEWLDANLDFDRWELTFVGRSPVEFSRIRVVSPLSSHRLADELRAHDAYLTASRDEAFSNALLEGLACGLPALYLRSGSNAEVAGEGGIGFDAAEQVPAALERLEREWAARRAAISVPTLGEVADRYLEVLRVGA
jgi:glycosyltransferase involved in cell wall biosynthesis